MGRKRTNREVSSPEPVRGPARSRVEERRRRFSEDGRGGSSRGLKPTTLFAIAGIAIALIVVVVIATRPSGVSAEVIQQVPSSTGAVEGGKVTVSQDEVKAKKIVFWDYKKADGTTLPLMAYQCPCGVEKVAVRICEPCNGTSFHVDGKELVCNTCGTRWDLETLKGLSGGCLRHPPDTLPTSVAGGKLVVDEAKVASWTPRPL